LYEEEIQTSNGSRNTKFPISPLKNKICPAIGLYVSSISANDNHLHKEKMNTTVNNFSTLREVEDEQSTLNTDEKPGKAKMMSSDGFVFTQADLLKKSYKSGLIPANSGGYRNFREANLE
jgi:hypothetical protein